MTENEIEFVPFFSNLKTFYEFNNAERTGCSLQELG